jgi:hypothetical protein
MASIALARLSKSWPMMVFLCRSLDTLLVHLCLHRKLARTRYVDSFALENGRECWLGKALPLIQQCTVSLL